jgi:hypothetical protein
MGKGNLHNKLARKRGADGETPNAAKKAKVKAETTRSTGHLPSDSKLPSRDTIPGDGPPHFRFGNTIQNDEWQTSQQSWEEISHWFANFKQKCIWQPFYYDGKCAEYLRQLGFTNVVHTNEDFFERVKDRQFMDTVDLIWDNPPYTTAGMKEQILQELVKVDKPFALLLPASVLHAKFLHDTLDVSKLQCIAMRKVHVRKAEDSGPVPFKYLVWLCYKTQLPRDLLFS